MRASWAALHAQLTRSASTLRFQRRFEALQAEAPGLARFSDPADLFDRLHAPGGDGIARNAVLRALVGARSGHEAAVTLLLLALWPGLDAVHRRLASRFRHDPDQLTSEIAGRLVQGILGLDLTRVTWVAATLIRNVERDIRRSLRRDGLAQSGCVALAEPDRPPSALGLPQGLDADVAAGILIDRLHPLLGADAPLIVAVAVQGARQHEAAGRFGCTLEAARKRYQRALARLRIEFEVAA